MIHLHAIPLLGTLVLVSAGQNAVGQPRTAWDPDEAARYLDDRMDLWFDKAKLLRTGEGRTTCVSCHTSVPYVLARPALRMARGQSHATVQEARLLEETVRRVTSHGSHEPLYADKEEESRGTEAVLNLLILAGDDARQNRPQPTEPTRQALEHLWATQRPDGAWSWLDFALEPTESAQARFYGATLAALAVGTVPGLEGGDGAKPTEPVNKLLAYLNGNYADQNIHHRAWMFLASTRLKGLLTREQRDALVAELQGLQNTDGGWSLRKLGPWTGSKSAPALVPPVDPDRASPGRSDGYATGLITYALRRGGMPVDHPAVKKATDWLVANQREVQIGGHRWKCWQTWSLNKNTGSQVGDVESWQRMFMSDGATAFAVLALLPAD